MKVKGIYAFKKELFMDTSNIIEEKSLSLLCEEYKGVKVIEFDLGHDDGDEPVVITVAVARPSGIPFGKEDAAKIRSLLKCDAESGSDCDGDEVNRVIVKAGFSYAVVEPERRFKVS